MNFDAEFPLKLMVNLGTRQDRRFAAGEQFDRAGITVARVPAVNARHVTSTYGFASRAKYACSLSKRLAIRRAIHHKAPAFVLFEDDIVFHPEFAGHIARIELPDDWAILYLGCLHLRPPQPVSPGLVRVTHAVDNHAVAFRTPVYRRAIRALSGRSKTTPPGTLRSSDVQLADLQADLACYSTFPNLVWQRESHSDNSGFTYSNYDRHGNQVYHANQVEHLST